MTSILQSQNSSFDDILKARMAGLGTGKGNNMDWIYQNDIAQVWEGFLTSNPA